MDNGATATWSGYNHQGKVGLFIALREMVSLIEPGATLNAGMFHDWYLEFEGPEDFDICKQTPCSNPEYIHSRHQVKAYAGQEGRIFSGYKKVVKPYTTDGGNHMPGFNKTILDENRNTLPNVELPVEKRFIHLVQAVPSWKSDLANNPNQVSPYKYPSYGNTLARTYCELSNSDITEQQDAPLDKMAFDCLKVLVDGNEFRIKLIWIALQVELQKRIADCHITGSKPKFTFKEVYEDFLDKNILLDTYVENYQIDMLRRSLINKWHEIQMRYENGAGIQDDERERIGLWLNSIHKMSNAEMKEFIDDFSPDMFPPHDDIQMSGFHAVICEVIRQVKLAPTVGIHHYKNEQSSYSLTTINDEIAQLPTVTLANNLHQHINRSSDNRYKSPVTIVTKNHDFNIDDPVFTEKMVFDNTSEGVAVEKIAGVDVPSIESYQLRRVLPIDKAIRELQEDTQC